MQDLKNKLSNIQSKVDSVFRSMLSELESTEAFIAKREKGFTDPLQKLEKELQALRNSFRKDSSTMNQKLNKIEK